MNKEKIEKICELQGQRKEYLLDLRNLKSGMIHVGMLIETISGSKHTSTTNDRYESEMIDFQNQLIESIKEKIEAIAKELEEL